MNEETSEAQENVNVPESMHSINPQETEQESGDLKKQEKQKSILQLNLQFYLLLQLLFSVDILLKPTGNAPIMKKKKWTVDADKQIGWIVEFMRKYLKLDAEEQLFLYVNQTFAPSLDQTVKNLYECYSAEGKLVLHYCKSQAWG